MRGRSRDRRGAGQQGAAEPLARAQHARGGRGPAGGAVRSGRPGPGPRRPGERRRYLDELATMRRPAIAARARRLRQSAAAAHGAVEIRCRGHDTGATRACWTRSTSGTATWPSTARELMAARIDLVNQLAPEVEKAYQLLAPGRGRRRSVTARAWIGEPHAGTDRGIFRSRAAGRACRPPRRGTGARGVSGRARTATIWSCGSAINPRKALPAMGNRGRWRWRCGWRRTNCCGPTAAIRCCCSTTCSPNSTRARRRALAAVAESAEQVLVTAAVPEDIPAGWDARRMHIDLRDERHRTGIGGAGDDRATRSSRTTATQPSERS